MAAFIVATALPIDIREAHDNLTHFINIPAQGKLQPPFGVLAQAVD